MDKSEGTDFISKTFSSLTDTVAKWYHTGHKKISLSSMKNAYREKLAVLGNKVFQLLDEGKTVTKDALQEEYKSVAQMYAQIAKAEEELKTIQAASAKKSRQPKTAKSTPAEAAKKTIKKKAGKTTNSKTAGKKAAPRTAKKTVKPAVAAKDETEG